MALYGLVRFDIEDFITAESDEALQFILDVMDEYQMPASYGVVGKKAQFLRDHGHTDILARLAEKTALGFHSTSHSEHPTIAEDLAPLSYDKGVAHFIHREQTGIETVTRLMKAPLYFTQPGGNWVPEACDALAQLHMPIFFSDSWNSYIVTLTQPMWIEDIVHWSLPVVSPKPFAMQLPDNLDQAVHMIEQAAQSMAGGEAFMIMVHPTELVTTKFWDAVNFQFGATQATLRKAPLRSLADRQQAFDGFRQYVGRIREIEGIEWMDVVSLTHRIRPQTPPRQVPLPHLVDAISVGGLGPCVIQEESFSAAELVVALALSLKGATPGHMLPQVKAPLTWDHPEVMNVESHEPLGLDRVVDYAQEIVSRVIESSRLPEKLGKGAVSIEHWAYSALFHVRHAVSLPSLPLRFLDYVKDPAELHWDWPIFPPDFQPYRLWQETRRLVWSLKLAQYQPS